MDNDILSRHKQDCVDAILASQPKDGKYPYNTAKRSISTEPNQ